MIERVLGRAGEAPSEYCFANLFLFRERHAYRLCADPVPHIRGRTYDGKVHALPLAPVDRPTLDALQRSGIDCLYPLGTEPSALVGNGWTTGWREADSDYCYDGAAMATLRFAKARRGQALHFARDSTPCFESWTDEVAAAARQVLDGWLADVGRVAQDTDYAECVKALAAAPLLGLEGGLVRTGSGEPVAFLLASVRDDRTRVVHFAKGRRNHSGAYPWMFAHYAEMTGAAMLNFEQDLGNPGLAQSKRAYLPTERRRKWRLNAPGQSDLASHLG